MPDTPDDFEDLLRRAHGYALALTHDASAAEDLVQEACVGVLRAGAEWSAPYVFRAVRNRFIDGLRQRRDLTLLSLDDPSSPISDDALLANEPPLPCDDARLWSLMGTLRPEAREALYLACVEGFTAREIADLTGRPRGTVLSLVHRARHQLREALAALAKEAP